MTHNGVRSVHPGGALRQAQTTKDESLDKKPVYAISEYEECCKQYQPEHPTCDDCPFLDSGYGQKHRPIYELP